MSLTYNGQAMQDKFVDKVLGGRDGDRFLEIGSHHPVKINNTFFLERTRSWSGIMVEIDDKWLPSYRKERPNSYHLIGDGSIRYPSALPSIVRRPYNKSMPSGTLRAQKARRSRTPDRYLKGYQAICRREAARAPADWTFKSRPRYRRVLEHVTAAQGMQYIRVIEDKFPELLKSNRNRVLSVAKENDRYGSPERHRFAGLGSFSPTSWRYVLHSMLILDQMAKKDVQDADVIEIGGGYGGLCLFLHRLAPLRGVRIGSYTILDLPAPAQLQRKYLGALGLSSTVCTTLDDVVGLKPDSFLVSCYAFSELGGEGDVSWRRSYREKVLDPYTSHGFLAWNLSPHYQFVTGKEIERVPEVPQTGTINSYVTY